MSQKEQVMTLTIKGLEEKDTDMYTCDVGTAKSMAKVTVNGKYICIRCLDLYARGVAHLLPAQQRLYRTEHQSLHHSIVPRCG